VTRLRQGFRLRQGYGGQVGGQAGTIFFMNDQSVPKIDISWPEIDTLFQKSTSRAKKWGKIKNPHFLVVGLCTGFLSRTE
jgi:hypothetical protein